MICRAAGITVLCGARTTTVLETSPVEGDPEEARVALARPFFQSLGPADVVGFQRWAGVSRADATATVNALRPELVAVDAAGRDRWILRSDADALDGAAPVPTTRLLALGLDPYLQADRDLVAPDASRRAWAWTPHKRSGQPASSQSWFPPAIVLVDGEIRALYRRQQEKVTVIPFEQLSPTQHEAVEKEAHALPIPRVAGQMRVVWAPAYGPSAPTDSAGSRHGRPRVGRRPRRSVSHSPSTLAVSAPAVPQVTRRGTRCHRLTPG